MKISSGLRATTKKSSVVSVKPMVNMISPRITVCVVPLTHSKSCGQRKVTKAIAIINAEAWRASQALAVVKVLSCIIILCLISPLRCGEIAFVEPGYTDIDYEGGEETHQGINQIVGLDINRRSAEQQIEG